MITWLLYKKIEGMIHFPLYLPGKKNSKQCTLLAADIGGTKTSLGLFEVRKRGLKLLEESTYPSKSYASFDDILLIYLKEHVDYRPDVLSIGVAGPVVDNKVQLTNLSWSIEVDSIKQERGIDKVCLLNDLEATAYGLVGVEEDDLAIVHPGQQKKENMAVLAPGTGLGEAGLFWDGSFFIPLLAKEDIANFLQELISIWSCFAIFVMKHP